jgi:hypothetical protein
MNFAMRKVRGGFHAGAISTGLVSNEVANAGLPRGSLASSGPRTMIDPA